MSADFFNRSGRVDGKLHASRMEGGEASWALFGSQGRYGLDVKPASRSHRYYVAARDLYSSVQFAADCIAIVTLSTFTGTLFHILIHGIYGRTEDFLRTGMVMALLFAVTDRIFGFQQRIIPTSIFDRVKGASRAWSLAFVILLFVFFALKVANGMSRGAVLSLYLLGLPAMSLWRIFVPIALVSLLRKTKSSRRECIIVADRADPLSRNLENELETSGYPSPVVMNFHAGCSAAAWGEELKCLLGRVKDAALDLSHGEIYICAGAIPPDRLAAIGRSLSILPRAIFVVPDAQTSFLARCKPLAVGGNIALEIRHEPLGAFQRVLKRGMDISVSLFALILFAPLLITIALAIKVDSRGPIFFRQMRNGYRGKVFKIWKFRSMSVMENGPVIQQARKNDPRVTRVGRILRKTSLDELPQLINILFGEMSLVGPRPHAMAHDELYSRAIENYEVRQHVKPGLTGWAQVNGLRGETASMGAMYQRIEYDLWYAVNASVLLDMEILARTAFEVVKQRNAY